MLSCHKFRFSCNFIFLLSTAAMVVDICTLTVTKKTTVLLPLVALYGNNMLLGGPCNTRLFQTFSANASRFLSKTFISDDLHQNGKANTK